MLRFPSLDVLQRWIRDGVVVKGDWIEHEEGGWTRVEAVTDLAVLMARAGGQPSEVPARPESEEGAPAPPPLPAGARRHPTPPRGQAPQTLPQGSTRPPAPPPEPDGPPTVAEGRPRSLDEPFVAPSGRHAYDGGPDTVLSARPSFAPDAGGPPTPGAPTRHEGAPAAPPGTYTPPTPDTQRAGAYGSETTWGWDDDAVEQTLRSRRRRRVLLAVLVMGAAAGLAIWAWMRGDIFSPPAEEPPATVQQGEAPPEAAPTAGGEEPQPAAALVADAEDAGEEEADTAETAAVGPDTDEGDADADADAGDADAGDADAGPEEADAPVAGEEAEEADREPVAKKPARKKRPAKPRPAPAYDPDDFDQVMARARRATSSDPVEALRLYRRALQLRPNHPDALNRVGQVNLVRLGNAGKAVEEFKACREAAPRYGPCLYWLGRAYEAAGQSGKATEAYRDYLAEYPGGSRAADARKRLGP